MCKVARLFLVCIISTMLALPSVVRANAPLGNTNRVSVASGGTEANGLSDGTSFSNHGRAAATRSTATNLIPEYSYPIPDTLSNEYAINSLIVVSSLDDSGPNSLRSAITQANEQAGDDVIEITAKGTIVLTGTLEITSNIVIIGPGASLLTISGDHLYRVFSVNGASTNFWLKGVTIANGYATGGSGGTSQNGAGGGGAAGMGWRAIYL